MAIVIIVITVAATLVTCSALWSTGALPVESHSETIPYVYMLQWIYCLIYCKCVKTIKKQSYGRLWYHIILATIYVFMHRITRVYHLYLYACCVHTVY